MLKLSTGHVIASQKLSIGDGWLLTHFNISYTFELKFTLLHFYIKKRVNGISLKKI